jgi:aldehyde dehydrogenase (NAD+)/aldehyde dehydrogenase (NAD(P)+)
LIISPWNYPFFLTLIPLAGAIAGGNTIAMKPSELAQNSSKVLNDIISETFDNSFVKVFNQDYKIVKSLINSRFDFIFYTGGSETGKVIMREASRHLIPVVMELGGKSPAIVDSDVNVKEVAKQIAMSKFINAGQTCVAIDYLFVHKSIKEELVRKIIDESKVFKQGSKIINKMHFDRLKGLIKDCKIISGGFLNPLELTIEPIIAEGNPGSRCMKEEIFGPILPIFEFNDIKEPIKFISSNPDPLVIYLYSRSEGNKNLVINKTKSGSIVINDSIGYLLNPRVGFGGVGLSGFGRYRGKRSFESFSYERILHKGLFLGLKHPPFSKEKRAMLEKILKFLY